ncbi:MAG: MBL fold metallo-hydrolase [Verrucomicrobiae bacterium]|nr:MBL fold metallo-hydrolase [Verrucomicrobiae bacterium]NNJ42333.1 MBL fold metallo-hydrolase [Akkermansiaceae bacterium]
MPTCSTPIPLEDDACDVIVKAMRGHGISTELLAQQASLTTTAVESAINGTIDPNDLEKIATVLQLSPAALIGLSSYCPTVQPPDGLYPFVTPFGHAGVNAYVMVHGRTASVFDTGTDARPILQYLSDHQLNPEAVYITHRHHDHTAGIKRFGDTPIIFPDDVKHGDSLRPGLTALDVSGHAQPARAYLYRGLDAPVCIVGDSVFAGSMGGTSNSSNYQLAQKTAREHIFSLPPETILCPGHGPLTSVALEQCHNPF